jgi:hypothetical protein
MVRRRASSWVVAALVSAGCSSNSTWTMTQLDAGGGACGFQWTNGGQVLELACAPAMNGAADSWDCTCTGGATQPAPLSGVNPCDQEQAAAIARMACGFPITM